MAKFADIYASTEQPFKIRCESGATATCKGDSVKWDASGANVSAVSAGTWEWELAVESATDKVLRERGYHEKFYGDGYTISQVKPQMDAASFHCPASNYPSTVAQITAICDLLDSYR